jgi:hypothetical protein
VRFTPDFGIFGVALFWNALLCTLLARWYVWPRLTAWPRTDALTLLLWPQTFRFLNLAAATESQVDPRIPHAWTLEIAWGDFAAAVLALGAIVALRQKARVGIALTWVATVIGLLDFSNSLLQGMLLDAANLPLRAVWYIAAGVVPPLFAAHILAVRLLVRSDAL